MSALASFIVGHMEDILGEWQKFASTVDSAQGMDRKALRDDAEWILTTIARDMQTHQSAAEQESKSQDTRPRRKDAPETAAEAHGAQRFVSGFDLNEMLSEYRALRATVIRLWSVSVGIDGPQAAKELTRFNEGMDQALSESVRYFAGQLDRSRELFMGVLGHDLRTPLQVIQISADKLLRSTDPIEQKKLGRFMHDAVNEMSQMLSDLLDTVRTQLGGSLPLQPLDVDTSAICQEAIEQFRIIHPRRELLCSVHSHLWGRWDAIRIRQLLNNLLRNALQHGSPGTPVTLTAKLEGDSAVLTVHNEGDPISPQLLANIFEPLRRGDAQREAPNSFSMGLGLYIVATITKAHRGEIQVTSTLDQGTTFRVTLPLASERCAS